MMNLNEIAAAFEPNDEQNAVLEAVRAVALAFSVVLDSARRLDADNGLLLWAEVGAEETLQTIAYAVLRPYSFAKNEMESPNPKRLRLGEAFTHVATCRAPF
jgi:hypothetical protein